MTDWWQTEPQGTCYAGDSRRPLASVYQSNNKPHTPCLCLSLPFGPDPSWSGSSGVGYLFRNILKIWAIFCSGNIIYPSSLKVTPISNSKNVIYQALGYHPNNKIKSNQSNTLNQIICIDSNKWNPL